MLWQTQGFNTIKNFFTKAAQSDGLSHCYLFTGQEMIGKRTFAIELADRLSDIPAGVRNDDRLVLDPDNSESGRSIGITEVRKIKYFGSVRPMMGKLRTIIINDAHLMTDEAQNALLKILEEPGSTVIFFLISALPELLLPTVVSRCQEIRFLPHPQKIVLDFLINYGLSRPKTDFLLKFSNGRLGLAKEIIDGSLFDQVQKEIVKFSELTHANINDRLVAAQSMADEKHLDDLPKKVLYWLLYMKTKLSEPGAARIARELLVLHQKISQPQYNARLALESFLIKI